MDVERLTVAFHVPFPFRLIEAGETEQVDLGGPPLQPSATVPLNPLMDPSVSA